MRLLNKGAMMIRRALLAAAIAVCGQQASFAQTPLAIWPDVDGTAYLWNTTDAPITFDGLRLVSDGRLDPAGWNSISDQVAGDPQHVFAKLGADAAAFEENAHTANTLSELTIAGGATLQPHRYFAIGRPFLDGANTEATSDFFYSLAGDPTYWWGDIWVPEPSTFLLAALAGTGLLAFRRRAPCGPQ
ncbi:MAG: PEP-CTERM sorting domain-containing protein [Pirellulales bacterium]